MRFRFPPSVVTRPLTCTRISFIVTISAWTQPGCKDASKDPHAEELGDSFKDALPGWCSTKKAAAIFFWFAFGVFMIAFTRHLVVELTCSTGFWAASLVLLVLDWRSGKLHVHRDPPFQHPRPAHDEEEGEEEDEDATYEHVAPVRRTTASSTAQYDNSESPQSPFADPQQRYPNTSQAGGSAPYTPAVQAGRPSMDAYGAFSDPAPSGFGSANQGGYSTAPGPYPSSYNTASPSRQYSNPPILPEPDLGGPMVSRTMQYADPYAAVRASIAGQQGPSSPTGGPPSYDSYQGYR